jgi:hypothetical protein
MKTLILLLALMTIIVSSGCIKQTINFGNEETTTTIECKCPDGYVQEGNICTPKCYFSTPRCLMPSVLCNSETTTTNIIQDDPFDTPPKGTSPNCGPEYRYKFDVTINSKNDFVNFIKNNEINEWVKLDNFKDNPEGNVNWNKVLTAIRTEKIGIRTVYVLDYNPLFCSGFTLKMTNDGYVSVYGCCGV